jgi:hypothetical protein
LPLHPESDLRKLALALLDLANEMQAEEQDGEKEKAA